MRYVYIALMVVFTGIVLLFTFQNLEVTTVSLFSASITLPISVLVLLTCVLGILAGGFVLALLRAWSSVCRWVRCRSREATIRSQQSHHFFANLNGWRRKWYSR